MSENKITKTMTDGELKAFCGKLVDINDLLKKFDIQVSLEAVYNTPEKGKHEITYFIQDITIIKQECK